MLPCLALCVVLGFALGVVLGLILGSAIKFIKICSVDKMDTHRVSHIYCTIGSAHIYCTIGLGYLNIYCTKGSYAVSYTR